MTEDQWTTSS